MVDKSSLNLLADVNSDEYKEVVENFEKDMNDDFNYALAISHIFDYINRINKLITEKKYQEALNVATAIRKTYKLLGLFFQKPDNFLNEIKEKFLNEKNINEEYINDLISKRKEYKLSKNYEEADKIRDLLLEKNIVINDTREGTFWDIN